MKIQIYTMQTVAEAIDVVASEVDHVSITPGTYGLPGEISFELAKENVDAVGKTAVSVALTVDLRHPSCRHRGYRRIWRNSRLVHQKGNRRSS